MNTIYLGLGPWPSDLTALSASISPFEASSYKEYLIGVKISGKDKDKLMQIKHSVLWLSG